ncbi:unnamed protein product [Owenia fusiformis]|uniref:Uncharacterized protein n=1 Tax=Owenia fusiformis TaxID=6347 RepID=A0A8J1YB35_OWEFU|nr:unnamed protein product [Owenia fusiformis]
MIQNDGIRLVDSRSNAYKRNLIIASLCAFLGPLSFGYVIGYSSPANPSLIAWGFLNEEQSTWFASLMSIGGVLGSPFVAFVMEKYGRKRALIFTSIPFICGWSFISAGMNVTTFYIGRILCGMGCGMIMSCTPVYISEMAPKEIRGALGTCVQLSVTFGIMFVYVCGMYVSWRQLANIGIVAPLLSFLLMLFMPETPRWYALKNRKQDALKVLTWLRGPESDIEDEYRDIEDSMDPNETMSWREFKRPELYQPLKAAIGLMIFQQMTGINIVMFYTVTIFESAGFKNGNQSTVIIGAVQVIGTLFSSLIIDRAGRRTLLQIGGLGMTIACFIFGGFYHVKSEAGWVAVGSLVLFTMSFAISWGPIPMLMNSEIFPVRARGTASSISCFTNWLVGFIITKQFILMQESLGQDGTFWLFGLFCFIATIFVWKTVPETKGKSLEDIELYFLGRAMRGI